MKIERTKNAVRNIAFGGIFKGYQILVPFLMRTAIIYFMGVQYLGLNSLFASILQVLNLAELGVGSAMVYSMYKPITEDNKEQICALMRLYRTYYRAIGLIIAAAGILLTPFIPRLIKGQIPDELNLYVLYFLNLGTTVLSYWLFAYKNCLLDAHQRLDVVSKVRLIVTSLQYLLQLAVIFIFRNYYFYLIIALVTQLAVNLSTAYVVSAMFPDYRPAGKVQPQMQREINKRIRDLFTAKIGNVIVNSADTIVISAFLGLTVLAVYQNYYYIITAVTGLIAIIFQSCTAGIGNSLIVETKEKNFNDLKKFTFLISWISGFCACCLLCLYQPFMEIWVGKSLMLEMPAVLCLCIYYFIYEINQLLNTYKDAAGIWNKDRFRPLVTALANLSLNLLTVGIWGIYGVILSTVLSMLLIGMPWLLHNLFSTLFIKAQLPLYLKKLALYTAVVCLSCILCGLVCSLIVFPPGITLALRAAVCFIIPNAVYFTAYHKTEEFAQSLKLADQITRGKLRIESRFTKGG